jgi:uncharacterized membrane protein HdeD (DUF308 family)
MQQATRVVFFGARSAHDLAHQWWVFALRGVCALVFGALAILAPGITLTWLLLLLAAYMLVDGVLAAGSAVMAARQHHPWGASAAEAVFGLVAGVVVLAWPGLTLLLLVSLAGVWAIFTGAALLMASFRFGSGAWPMGLGAAVSIVVGCLLLAAPVEGALVLSTWLGLYALIFGVTMIGMGLRLRHLGRRLTANA